VSHLSRVGLGRYLTHIRSLAYCFSSAFLSIQALLLAKKPRSVKLKTSSSAKYSKRRRLPKSRGGDADSEDEDRYMDYGSSDSEAENIAGERDSDSDDEKMRISRKKRKRVSDSNADIASQRRANRGPKIEEIDVSSILSLEVVIKSPEISVEDISSDTVQDLYEDAVKFVKDMDLYGFFANPVTEEIAPGYFSVIKEPMDISTIEAKTGTAYRCFEELSDDITLMLKNCMAYNSDGSSLFEVK